MTKELFEALKSETEESLESNDQMRIIKSNTRFMIALADCQMKTSERVKKLEKESEERKLRIEGAKWMWGFLKTAGVVTLTGTAAWGIKFIGGLFQ